MLLLSLVRALIILKIWIQFGNDLVDNKKETPTSLRYVLMPMRMLYNRRKNTLTSMDITQVKTKTLGKSTIGTK